MQKRKEICLLDKLYKEHYLNNNELFYLIENFNKESLIYSRKLAQKTSVKNFGNNIYYRGIIEFSNFCRNDCFYCGLRCSNKEVVRYRLDAKQILKSCNLGYKNGIRTFVLQGGEDIVFDDELNSIVKLIKENFDDCAITLSVGEREIEKYKKWYKSGATRFLLRHETANQNHYEKLHPSSMSFENRMNCLHSLKKIGYQTGAGMMVGSPFQNNKCILNDLIFLRDFKPEMVGVGPFIPHSQTPFYQKICGSFDFTLYLLSIIRLLLPLSLIPATTAMDTLKKDGRIEAILSGCNVIMLNITPKKERVNYKLYNDMAELRGKSNFDINELNEKYKKIGYQIVIDRGDFKKKRGGN